MKATDSLLNDNDWPGVFIRGDNALNYAVHLQWAITRMVGDPQTIIARAVLQGLLSDLRSCEVKAVDNSRAAQVDSSTDDQPGPRE